MSIKIKNKKTFHFIGMLLAVVVGMFLLGKVEKASAKDGFCVYKEGSLPDPSAAFRVQSIQNVSCTDETGKGCNIDGSFKGGTLGNSQSCKFFEKKTDADAYAATLQPQANAENNAAAKQNQGEENDVCGLGFLDTFSLKLIKCLFLYILRFEEWLLAAAATMFVWVIKPEVFMSIVNSDAIKTTWAIVRDALNVVFILVLLYSAFCTVFQITKHNYKNVLFQVILMALLVNFSYPIARFIIDVGNSLMYYLLGGLNIGPDAYFSTMASKGGLNAIIHPPAKADADLTFLIAAVIFVFIYAITIGAIAILMFIRAVTLAIVVISSPIGFVGTILPGSDLSKHANTWWNTLMETSFFGPIIIFMMFVAMKMMESISTTAKGSFASAAGSQSGSSEIVGAIGFFAIPIVILWMGIGIAKKSSIAGADMVMGKVEKWANTAIRAPYKIPRWGFNKTGIPGGMKKKVETYKKSGVFGTDAVARREGKIAGVGPYSGGEKAKDAEEKKKIQETRDEWKKAGGASAIQIDDALNGKDKAKQKAAAIEAAEKNGFVDLAQYQKAMAAVKGDPLYENLFGSKVKEKHVKLIIENEIHDEEKTLGRTLTPPEKDNIYSKHLDKLNADQLSKQKGLHENIDKEPEFKRYVEEMATDKKQEVFHRELFKKMTKEQQKVYIKNNLNPQ